MNRNLEISSNLFSSSGFGKFSRNLIDPLLEMNVNLSLRNYCCPMDFSRSELRSSNLIDKESDIDGSFVSILPVGMLNGADIGNKIVFFKSDLNAVPKKTVDLLREASGIFAAGEFTKNILVQSGISSRDIRILRPCVQRINPSKIKKISFSGRRRFCFLTVVRGVDEIEWADSVKTYLNSFKEDDDVCLVIKTVPGNTNAYMRNEFLRKVSEAKKEISPSGPPIIVLNSELSDSQMCGLYLRSDCFIKPYSFGIGMSIVEAFQSGAICVGPECSDCMDMINENSGFLLRKIGEEKIKGKRHMESVTYNKYDLKTMGDIMRYVYENGKEVKEKFNKARKLSLSPFLNSYAAYDMMMKLKDRDT